MTNNNLLIKAVAKQLGVDEHRLRDECLKIGLNLMLCDEGFRRGIARFGFVDKVAYRVFAPTEDGGIRTVSRVDVFENEPIEILCGGNLLFISPLFHAFVDTKLQR